MNSVSLIGRATKDAEVRMAGETKVASYSLAVDRRGEGTDFINITAFGKAADFAEKWVKKGIKLGITGYIHTGSYEKDGRRVYTFEVVAGSQEFCEPKKKDEEAIDEEAFMDIPFD